MFTRKHARGYKISFVRERDIQNNRLIIISNFESQHARKMNFDEKIHYDIKFFI